MKLKSSENIRITTYLIIAAALIGGYKIWESYDIKRTSYVPAPTEAQQVEFERQYKIGQFRE